ncbi:hypothetical protein [Methanobacterium paludis]|uniref:Uncharacterized protein n=1 Tax=Methanobacterium paludis (strain DSM 25820 / JCM 18151 / SWAN1) TaxID=868131 RepID=F6D2U3_METPW|nr:hypothetical protein [Methanobacterium paludis]AEG18672.1 hypothetical protein MSWAN_1661 [Methanobacterium paludis]
MKTKYQIIKNGFCHYDVRIIKECEYHWAEGTFTMESEAGPFMTKGSARRFIKSLMTPKPDPELICEIEVEGPD